MTTRDHVERISLRVLQFCLPLAFLTPFVYTSDVTFPFVVGKVWAFRLLVELLLPFYVALLVVAPRFRIWREPLVIAVAAYLAAQLVSGLLGVDPARSFWANHERMTGVFSLLHYGAFFFMAATVYATGKHWRRVFLASLAASAVMSVLALYERAHPGFMANPGGGRVWGTLGNYIYLANYLLFHLFFIALIVFRKQTRWSLRAVLIALGIVEALVVLFTETRGTLLAIIVTGFVLGFWAAVRERRWRIPAIAALIVLLAFGGIMYAQREQEWVRRIPGVGKLVRTTLSEGGGVRTRFIAWEIALQAFRDRPLTGYGPENFYYAFNLHYNPESYRYGVYETWFDRSHNTLLDVLAMTGLLGAVTYVALFAAAVWTIERKIRAGEMRRWEGMLAGGMLLAYVLQNLTVFDSHASYLYFYLTLAYVASRKRDGAPAAAPASARAHGAIGMGIAAMTGAIALGVFTNVLPYEANRHGLIGTSLLRLRGDVAGGIAAYERGLATPTPHKADLRADAAREIADLLQTRPYPPETAAPALAWAIARVEENRAERTEVYDGLLLGQLLIAQAQYDPSAAARAREVLEAARPLSPDRQQLVFALVQLALMEGRAQDAVALLEESLAKEEAVRDVHWNLALAYHATGNMPAAARAVTRARELGYQWRSAEDVLLAVQIFRGAGDFAQAKEGAQLLVQALPQNGLMHFVLAEVLADLGEKERARAEAQRARELDPSLNERVTLFLQGLPAGQAGIQ